MKSFQNLYLKMTYHILNLRHLLMVKSNWFNSRPQLPCDPARNPASTPLMWTASRRRPPSSFHKWLGCQPHWPCRWSLIIPWPGIWKAAIGKISRHWLSIAIAALHSDSTNLDLTLRDSEYELRLVNKDIYYFAKIYWRLYILKYSI